MSFTSTYTSYNVYPQFDTTGADCSKSEVRASGGKLSGDLITFLAIADIHQIDLAYFRWDDALGSLGAGGTAHVSQSTYTARASLAFKRYASSPKWTKADLSKEYQVAIAEALALSHDPTRWHPNLVTLEGITWESSPDTQQFLPVLLFEKATHGDLCSFFNSSISDTMDFPTRLRLCQHIGTGLVALHRFGEYGRFECLIGLPADIRMLGLIHGDVNPRNILVFDDNGKFLPKLCDFGYAALMAGSDAMRLATTWPWYAPEAEYTWSFNFTSAQKTDIYSFGVVCMWILFRPVVSHLDVNVEALTPLQWIEALRRGGDLIAEAINMVESIPLTDKRQRSRLQQFFQRALADVPENRSIYLQGLFNHDEAEDDYGPLPGHLHTPYELPYAALFTVRS